MKKFLVACLTLILAFMFGVNAMAAKAEAFVINEPCTIDGKTLDATITCTFTNLGEEKDSFLGYTEGCTVTAKQDGNTTNCKVTEPGTAVTGKLIAPEGTQTLTYAVTLYDVENPFTITFEFDNGKTFTKNFIIKGNAVILPEETETTTEKPTQATPTEAPTEKPTEVTLTEATPTELAGTTDAAPTLPTAPATTAAAVVDTVPNTGNNGVAIGVFSALAIVAGCGGALAITKKQKRK